MVKTFTKEIICARRIRNEIEAKKSLQQINYGQFNQRTLISDNSGLY